MIDEKKFGACYCADVLRKLYDRPLTLLEVLTRNDTPEWKEVPAADRLWVAERRLNGVEALWTPEEKSALIEALKLRVADFKKDYEKKAFKDRDIDELNYKDRNYKDRIEDYEDSLKKAHPHLSTLFYWDSRCQSSKYGYYADRDKHRDLVDTCIAVLTPKETIPCQTLTLTDPTASSPVMETTTTQPATPELEVSQISSENSVPSKKKVAKPRKPSPKKGPSGKVSKPATAKAKKPS